MIAETLAGIALVKQSVDFIKSNINTAKDIGDIAGAVEGLFRGQEKREQETKSRSQCRRSTWNKDQHKKS